MTRKLTQLSIKLVVLVCLTALPAAAFAADNISDSQVKVLVERELTRQGMPLVGTTVSVDDRIVTLTGTVSTLAEKEKTGRTVRGVYGVQRVVNNLAVPVLSGDVETAKAVRKSILTQPYYGVFDWIEGEVQDGNVKLVGWVREPLRKTEIEKRLMMIPGIAGIENRIEVLPLSNYDDQIRLASLRLINRDSTLSRYALGANPSIHLIVDNGRVTLKGVVLSKFDRQIAETVLRTNLLAFDVKNELQIEGAE